MAVEVSQNNIFRLVTSFQYTQVLMPQVAMDCIVQRVTCFTDSAATTKGSSMREISDTNQTQVY